MASETDNLTEGQLQPSPISMDAPSPAPIQGIVYPEDVKTKWEKQVWRWLHNEAMLLKLYQRVNGTDFIMTGMLMAIKDFDEGMKMAKAAYEKATIHKEKMEHMNLLTKMQRQQMQALKDLAKYQEQHYHASVKEKRAVRSAMPGQKISVAPGPRSSPPVQAMEGRSNGADHPIYGTLT